jgi:hypothetical protein
MARVTAGLDASAGADPTSVTVEERRLREARAGVPWRSWGPYLSERQWGTVREDYSDGGEAWSYFSHDQARSRAYRWGEDGLAGISDDHQRLCLALALWNERDPILKERLFGGNSNWRGPVWFPINLLLIRALLMHYRYYGDDLTVECPTGSGTMMTLFEVAQELSRRLVGTFLRDDDGRRPVYGGTRLFQEDPHWRDLILFYEYFHGDNGAGLGASHQTGWTGLVARLIQSLGKLDAASALEDHHWPFARPYRRLAGRDASATTAPSSSR